MIVDIKSITATEFQIKILSKKDYKFIDLRAVIDQNNNILIDRLDVDSGRSENNIIKQQDNQHFLVNANNIDFSYIYYKEMFIELRDADNNIVDISETFNLKPKGKKDLIGIISKLQFDFNKLWNISGVYCYLFFQKENKCEKCWDFELNQRIRTDCECSKEIKFHKFKARRVKLQTQQIISEKNIQIIKIVYYNTFDRSDFNLGMILFDSSTREFFEIKNSNVASIGGIRTSTTIIAQYINSDDDKLTSIKKYIAEHPDLFSDN